MSIFKIFLMIGLMSYTFVTMVGGNPRGDPYGFRYWQNPVGGISKICLLVSISLINWVSKGVIRRIPRPREYWSLCWSAILHDPRLFHV